MRANQQALLGVGPPLSAGITVGNVTSLANGTLNSTTLSGNHTVTSGSNKILIVSIPESRNVTISSVTYNGVSLTAGLSVINGSTSARLYYLVNPPIGTYTLTITYSASNQYYICGIIDLSGVNQTTPFGATNTKTGIIQNKTISLTTTVNNSYLIECFGDSGTTNTPTSGQTYISNGVNRSSAYSTTTTAGSYTRNWTGDISSDYAQLIAEIKPA